MDFNTFVGKAWDEHATDSQAVAQRLSEGMPLVTTEPELTRLMDLAHHVHGQHLGTWRAGTVFIERLATLPPFAPEGASGQALRRCVASLAVCERADAELGALAPSDRIRVAAMAATNLAEHDSARAMQLLQQALGQAEPPASRRPTRCTARWPSPATPSRSRWKRRPDARPTSAG